MNKKQWLGLGLVAVAALGLAACGNRSSRNADSASTSDVKTKAAIVTDTGVLMTNHLTNQLGKVFKLGVRSTIFQKIRATHTSNQQVKLTMLTT